MVTVAIPYFIGVLSQARDTKRSTGLQRLSRAAITSSVNSTVPQNFEALKDTVKSVGAVMPISGATYCYVYGVQGNNFFAVVLSESNKRDFIVEGTKKGGDDFEEEIDLQQTLQTCGTLTTPTTVNGYHVFYLP